MGNIKCILSNKTQNPIRVTLDYSPGKSGFINREIKPGESDSDEFRQGPEALTIMITSSNCSNYREVIPKNDFEGEMMNIEIYEKKGEFIVVHNKKTRMRLQATKINVINHSRSPVSVIFTDQAAKPLKNGTVEANILNQIEIDSHDDEIKVEVVIDKEVITRKVPIQDKVGEVNIHEFDGKLIVITEKKTKELLAEFMEKLRLGKEISQPEPKIQYVPVPQENVQYSQMNNSQYGGNLMNQNECRG